ncbi:MAG: tripartite tricarboxylate transporter substrate binding protein [Oceanospirillaceae bacterium]|uniref:tripartite tricarboxylate transporter substrate binding protein n=1 Tax=Marinobacterium litorale TaxID=404770 RepID=UPI000424805B|nr:tripartite tricarboxylate transporter substrate binding protein [Marinobacterium litorale]MBS99005.1 tripartite tricarboxylate transporter substrate binding protein [Oceanospirillaceae bacterium]
MNRKSIFGLAAAALMATTGAFAEYPEKNIHGIIQWGAGGSTDTVTRTVSKLAEKHLGKEIVLVNRPGGTGVIATTYVNSRPADGYTLLFGAENPQLYGVMGLSDLSYSDFYPVNVLARNVPVILTHKDAPWDTMSELLEYVQANPNEVKMGSTGPGGLSFVVDNMIQGVTDFDVKSIPFDGTGPGVTALLGGHVDFMPVGLSAARENIRAGRAKALAVLSTEQIEGFENTQLITDVLPEFKQYLPWGPFYGVFVKKDAPDDVKQKLSEAFSKAVKEPEFQNFLSNFGAIEVNLSGEEATQWLNRWQSVTTWLLQDGGAAKVSPEELGIPRP